MFKKIQLYVFTTLILSQILLYASTNKPILSNGNIAHNYAIRVYYDTPILRNKLMISYEPLEENRTEHFILLGVDEYEHQRLLDTGLKVQIDRKMTEKMNVPPEKYHRNVSSSVSPSRIENFACYRTVEETYATATHLVETYPNLVSWINVGDSWEKSNGQGGYALKVLKITNHAIHTQKPALFITSSIHAREYTPAELATRFAEYLLGQYGSNADITWMLDYHEIHLMLIANPDGRKHAELGKFWRKNTHINTCENLNLIGTDLNRNFSFNWANELGWNDAGKQGSSSAPCSEVYHGEAASSEPEVDAIERYMTVLFGDHRGPGLEDKAGLNTSGIYLDIHSYSQLILWPWGFTSKETPNNLHTLGKKLAYFNQYTPQKAMGLYPSDGTTIDFAYGKLGIPSYVFELGTKFFQSCSIFENIIVPHNFPALLYALKSVRKPYTLAQGPEILNVELNVTSVQVGESVMLYAKVDGTRYNHGNDKEQVYAIENAHYSIDQAPWITGTTFLPMDAGDGTYNSSIENIHAEINTDKLSVGKHILYIEAENTAKHKGVISAIYLNVTKKEVPKGDQYEVDNTKEKATVLTLDKIQTHSIHNHGKDIDYMQFTLEEKETLIIETSGNSIADTRMWLYDHTGKQLVYNDDGGRHYYSKITKTLASGTYYIKIEEYGQNDTIEAYTISLSIPHHADSYEMDNTKEQASLLSINQSQVHSIHNKGKDIDYMKFTIDKKYKVTIETSGIKKADTRMWLYDTTGKELAYNDDGGMYYYSKIQHTLEKGSYIIRIDEYGQNNEIESYTLSLHTE